jgi:acetyl esterase
MTRSISRGLHAAKTFATVTVLAASLAACGGDDGDDTVSEASRATEPMPTPNTQMQAVLDQLTALGAKPIETLTPAAARTQPGPPDAVKAVLTKQGRSTAPEAVGSVVDRTITGPVGPLAVRVYTPAGTGPFPVVFYIHGGGWVIATIDTYDSSARALTNAANAIVVSTEYNKAPEFKFPTAHNDTYAAYKWTLTNAASLNGLPTKVAIAGESAGGNMAASITMRAKADGVQMPVHQVLVYPVTNYAFNSPSQQQNAKAMPLGTATLAWFYEKYLPTAADGANPQFSVLQATSLAGLPTATVITADIDPLRSEGRAYADKLQAAGVATKWQNFEGVTHEFFGMGAVVDQAKSAVSFAGNELKAAFAR